MTTDAVRDFALESFIVLRSPRFAFVSCRSRSRRLSRRFRAQGLKTINPFLQRANEMERVDGKVAYYCRMFAVQEGLKLDGRSAAVNAALRDAMEKLERAKPSLALDADDDELYCESFAMKIFSKADEADRGGARGLNTAKSYYAASVFFEMLRQFNELERDIQEKQRYAAWRAGVLMKAVRTGEVPPPPPGDDEGGAGRQGEEAFATTSASDASFDATAERFYPSSPPPPPPPSPPPPPPPHVSVKAFSSATPGASHIQAKVTKSPVTDAHRENVITGKAPPGISPPKVDIGSIADAQRHAKNAVSALGFDDVRTAKDSLRKALDVLERYS